MIIAMIQSASQGASVLLMFICRGLLRYHALASILLLQKLVKMSPECACCNISLRMYITPAVKLLKCTDCEQCHLRLSPSTASSRMTQHPNVCCFAADKPYDTRASRPHLQGCSTQVGRLASPACQRCKPSSHCVMIFTHVSANMQLLMWLSLCCRQVM